MLAARNRAPSARPAAPSRAPSAALQPRLRSSLAPRNQTLPARPFTSASPEVSVRQGKAKEKEGGRHDKQAERSPAHTHQPRSLSAVGAPFGFDDFDAMWHNMDRLANRMMRNPFGGLGVFAPELMREFRDFAPTAEGAGEGAARTLARWRPAVDIQEDKEKYTVHAELPGLRKEDVKVEVDEGVLTLRGERKLETKEEDKERRYTRVERQYGSFMRRFPLPKDVDAAAIKASFKDGVLEVRLPRSTEKAKNSEIVIE